MLPTGKPVSTMKILAIFALVLAFFSRNVSGYGREKDGKCPPRTGDENCAFRLLNSEFVNTPCTGQDFECPGDEKCCDDGCAGYECKPAIGLPPLPVIEPHCISSEIRVGDQCEPANVTYCLAEQCNKCCIHNSICSPTSDYISKEECEKKLCKGIVCPGQGEVCTFDKYHRAVCKCPSECPPDTPNSPVCGSDGVTYENECKMNMSACVTGDWIDVVNQGPCLPPTQKSPLDICSQKKDMGHGWTYELKYFFNKETGICQGFLYHGKGGNENNFDKFKDCEDFCADTIIDVCALPKVTGPCRAAFPRWHYNNKVRRCEKFTYGGCSGNRNNFRSEDECESQCICSLPKAEGRCYGYFPSWFYNFESGQCEQFVYGGCGGNTNRFFTKDRCLKRCGGLSVNSTDVRPKPQCQDKNKFNCRSIKKCLPANLKCNGVDDCGDNSDEEGCDPCANKTCKFYSQCVKTQNNTAVCDCPTICGEIWQPVCASDNQTYPNECEMQVESCKKQQHIEIIKPRECGARAPTKCELARAEKLQMDIIGTYIPLCENDGSYSSVQCHGSTGSCWCVDREGNKLIETELRFKRPNCTKVEAKPKSKCEKERDAATNGPPLVGAFTPQCESDGSYSSVQCHSSTGYCWCVDGEGNKLIETELRFERPNCTEEQPPPTEEPFNICDIILCTFGRCVLVDGNATCQCNKACPLIYAPVCGTDNVTYPNLCVMDNTACEKKEHIQVQYKGECGKEQLPPTEEPFNICDITLCEFGRCVLVDGNATCQCNKACPLIYAPVCGTDNKTYANICELKSTACQRKEHVQVEHGGRCGSKVEARLKSKCEKERDAATNGPPLLGAFTPQCENDGSYSKVQCRGSTGYCWCVDGQGNKQAETELRFERPNCTEVVAKPKSKCEKERDAATNGPLVGAFTPQCESDGSYSSVQCHGSTGYCWCIDGEGNKLIETELRFERPNCTEVVAKPKSKCEKERDAVTNGPPLVGAFTPQCESDGSYSKVQCHGSTGYCWCVDGEGNKLIETELRFERPNCTEVVAKPKSKCEKERDAVTNGPPLVGAFTPQCESDGSYSKVQCHSSTGYCWCVDGEGNKLIETELRFERPNCTEVVAKPKSKCEKERDAVTNGPPLVGAFTPQCESDGSYSKVQCYSSTGYCWCVDGERKKLIETELRFERPNCTGDLLAPTEPPIDICDTSLCHFGQCVNVNGTATCVCNKACPFIEQPVCGSDNKTYPSLCVMDSDACERKERIKVKHSGPCGKSKCEKELESALANPMPGGDTPRCDEDGSYSAKQCHSSSGYCWCVTRHGKIIPSTKLRFQQPNCSHEPLEPCADVKCDFHATCVPLGNGEHICDCPRFCTADFSPVCASNNVTYDNECMMKVASCEMQEMLYVQGPGQCGLLAPTEPPIDICDTSLCDFGKCVNVNGTAICVCNKACPFIEQPVCGSDNKTYSNLCVMDSDACERKERVTVKYDGPCEEALPDEDKLCADAKCEFHSDCEVINGSAKCKCRKSCTREYNPKCGSDNITYGNPCELRRASCEEMREIEIVKDGECDTPTIAPVTVTGSKNLPKCGKCPLFGKENLMKSFCDSYNKFAIVGEILNVTNGGTEIDVKVDMKFKPRGKKTRFTKESTVHIVVKKGPNCRCENAEFKTNEKYVLIGKKGRKTKAFEIKWKTGFVEKISKPLVKKLDKRSKQWRFCAQKNRG